MKKTQARLADGREIIYYDESDDAVRTMPDPRHLPAFRPLPTVRYDALLDEWVGLADHRHDRTYLPPDDQCPLCPSTVGRHTEIPPPAYDVVVFENRFPAFAAMATAPDLGTDLGPQRPGVGRCEVVCFTADHDSSFSALTPARVFTVIEAWADRTLTLSSLPHVEQVFCFENRGAEIGVTLSHPHGQIYAYPFLTPRTRQTLSSARAYRERTWGNLFADVLAAEQRGGERVVVSGDLWTAFVPFAARWPLEVHLYPHRQAPDLPSLSGAERAELSRLYLDVLRRMEAVFDDTLPYIAAWHQAPVRIDRDLAYLHLQLFSIRRAAGKLKYLAGSESAMGAFVNDVSPEAAARLLRDAG
ncbi:MAG TPA: galactose-1-phosphate uridylyltransferase [Streptosporangiaceae bacterium]|jgi:UDPglucose--hexose-1-phosphate uridylyltransferase|nr:galactose-1-phosphate uridylyltransferase [Streptosporangiaceae bacterium]